MENEIWKDVPGYEGLYKISSTGKVKSLFRVVRFKNHTRDIKEKILKVTLTPDGYYRVELNKDCKGKKYPIHRLVALAFISNNENKPAVNHIDGDKTNNNISNLEWVTSKENTVHGFKTGLIKVVFGEGHVRAKLLKSQVTEIRQKFKSGQFKNQTKVA